MSQCQKKLLWWELRARRQSHTKPFSKKIVVDSCFGPMASPGKPCPQTHRYQAYFCYCGVGLKLDQIVIGSYGEQIWPWLFQRPWWKDERNNSMSESDLERPVWCWTQCYGSQNCGLLGPNSFPLDCGYQSLVRQLCLMYPMFSLTTLSNLALWWPWLFSL